MFHLKPKPSPPWSVGRETAGKGRRFLGDGDRAGEASVDELVGATEEGDRLAVFLAAVRVGQPLAFAAGIVEVEHRGDGVDAQAVDMEPVDPVERVAIEEIRHLVPAEIVDRGVPVRMKTLARIGVLVQGGAVEARQAVLVGGEMRRRPVEDDAETRRMGAVDEAGESGRLAEAARRSEEADRLVAPGLVERMLADRQQLDMGVAHVGDIRDELVGELVVGEERSVEMAPPRAEMDLVDRHRLAAGLALGALRHVLGVGPGEIGAVGDDRGGRGPEFGLEAERIGFERQKPAVRSGQFKLVDRSGRQVRDENLP